MSTNGDDLSSTRTNGGFALSRREFIKTATVGASGASALLVGRGSALAASPIVGEITLDTMMIT